MAYATTRGTDAGRRSRSKQEEQKEITPGVVDHYLPTEKPIYSNRENTIKQSAIAFGVNQTALPGYLYILALWR